MWLGPLRRSTNKRYNVSEYYLMTVTVMVMGTSHACSLFVKYSITYCCTTTCRLSLVVWDYAALSSEVNIINISELLWKYAQQCSNVLKSAKKICQKWDANPRPS